MDSLTNKGINIYDAGKNQFKVQQSIHVLNSELKFSFKNLEAKHPSHKKDIQAAQYYIKIIVDKLEKDLLKSVKNLDLIDIDLLIDEK